MLIINGRSNMPCAVAQSHHSALRKKLIAGLLSFPESLEMEKRDCYNDILDK